MVHLLALRRAELHLSKQLRGRAGFHALHFLAWPRRIQTEDEVRQGRNNMAGENSGRKPEKPGGLGMEKDPPAPVEAAPRSKRMAYICWNDGASNFVEPGWEWFTCWRCGALVYTA